MNSPEFLRTPVESSLLTAVAYSTNQTLQLEFRRGAVYRYFAVPPTVFQGLITAESKRGLLQPEYPESFSLSAALLNHLCPTPRRADQLREQTLRLSDAPPDSRTHTIVDKRPKNWGAARNDNER